MSKENANRLPSVGDEVLVDRTHGEHGGRHGFVQWQEGQHEDGNSVVVFQDGRGGSSIIENRYLIVGKATDATLSLGRAPYRS